MSQFDFGAIDPSSMSGTELAAALGSFRDALNSHHSGGSRPSYVQEGMIWVSKATSPYTVYFYDGISDIALFTIDQSTHAKTVPDYAPLASPGLSGTPTAPTQSAKNSSTRLATTAFVQTDKGYRRAITTLTASTTLTSTHLGNLVVCNATAATTMTLPAASSYLQGILSLVNINTGPVTLSGSIIYDGATVTSRTLPAGASVDLVSNGTSWVVIQQTLPDKVIAEWITGTDSVPAPISPEQLAAAVAALAAHSAGVPIGSVVFMPSVRTPIGGYIAGNGAAISRAAYADLDAFMYVGDDYNAAAPAWYRCTSTSSPSTTRSTTGDYIVLPDFRGVFPRFLDDGRGYDSSRNVNSYQADTFASHSHTAQMYGAGNGSGSGAQARSEGTGSSTLTTSAVGAAETRPKNIAMRGWIKY